MPLQWKTGLTFNATPSDGGDGSEGGGIPEAPQDGRQYGRQDASWTEIIGGGSGVLSPVILAGTVTPITISDIASNVDMISFPLASDDVKNCMLTIDIRAEGPVATGNRYLSAMLINNYPVGSCSIGGQQDINIRFVVCSDDTSFLLLPFGPNPYLTATTAVSRRAIPTNMGIKIRGNPGEGGTLTLHSCLITRWRP